ncbi:hypothetical protein Pan241w_42080 [Gimesia alba]|uniref:Uncharacterized protein n=1 Tax=Gimesia alba TaxID=2527973 RepID=A0A517RJR7_9PLAN|nr:hypothetical protein [Gimesia alba]QDT44102.1 hypothetical protein Pan241w_42080 [Gimesia alba]
MKDRRKLLRESLIAALVFFVSYVGIYITLSCLGGYYFSQSGIYRYRSIGLSVSDISIWNPKGCRFQARFKNIRGEYVSRGNELGYFFSPLIMIDRKWFHPTINHFDSDELK